VATPKQTGINASLIAAQVDELGALERELAPVQLKISRVEALRKAIRAHFDASPADQPFEATGERFLVAVGPRATQRSINFVKLIKLLGAARFAKFATCTLAALAEHAPGMEASVVTSAPTGARPLKTFERGKAA
jgi:hypothetical protein